MCSPAGSSWTSSSATAGLKGRLLVRLDLVPSVSMCEWILVVMVVCVFEFLRALLLKRTKESNPPKESIDSAIVVFRSPSSSHSTKSPPAPIIDAEDDDFAISMFKCVWF